MKRIFFLITCVFLVGFKPFLQPIKKSPSDIKTDTFYIKTPDSILFDLNDSIFTDAENIENLNKKLEQLKKANAEEEKKQKQLLKRIKNAND